MVGTISLNEPIRSFVRVPGSGADKNLQPTLCDLSKVANIAPSAPDSSGLLDNKKSTISNSENKKIIKVTTNQLNLNKSNTGSVPQQSGLKRQLNDDNLSPPPKVARSDNNSASIAIKIDFKELTELKQEYFELQKTNEELVHKLSMFQSLFKDRTKLNEVLARLDEVNAISYNQNSCLNSITGG